MGSYYYLVAQLPYIVYGQPTTPMSSAAFKELAKGLLSPNDSALLDMVSLDPQTLSESGDAASYAEPAPSCGSDFIDNWREWERVLRLNLAKHRFVKAKREGTVPVEPPVLPADAASAAAKAIAVAESPLEAEVFIDRARWSAIENLQGPDYFSRNTVFAYLLKILLLERRAAFQVETGFSEYKSLYASILENAQAGVLAAGEHK